MFVLASHAAAAPKAVPAPATAGATAALNGTPAVGSRELVQFRSAGHVLGFTTEEMLVAGNDHLLKVRFVGARPVVPVALARDAVPGGARPVSQGVAALSEVHYRNLWPGIDLRYDQSGIVRSTWTLAPGASVEAIRLAYNVPVEIAPDGALSMRFGSGTLTETAPIAWQEIDGSRQPVTAAFQKWSNGELGFQVGDYDATKPLIIDPTLLWNTFLGNQWADVGTAITTDATGNVYVAGRSDDDWDVDAVQDFAGGRDAFAARLAGDSGVLSWHTFLGSPGSDFGYAIASDTFGNVYVAGRSPVTWGAPLRPISPGGDAFVARLTAANGALTSHSFLGGEGADEGLGIACDALGSAIVTGSSDATWGSPVRAHTLFNDVFVVRLDGEFVFADGFE